MKSPLPGQVLPALLHRANLSEASKLSEMLKTWFLLNFNSVPLHTFSCKWELNWYCCNRHISKGACVLCADLVTLQTAEVSVHLPLYDSTLATRHVANSCNLPFLCTNSIATATTLTTVHFAVSPVKTTLRHYISVGRRALCVSVRSAIYCECEVAAERGIIVGTLMTHTHCTSSSGLLSRQVSRSSRSRIVSSRVVGKGSQSQARHKWSWSKHLSSDGEIYQTFIKSLNTWKCKLTGQRQQCIFAKTTNMPQEDSASLPLRDRCRSAEMLNICRASCFTEENYSLRLMGFITLFSLDKQAIEQKD